MIVAPEAYCCQTDLCTVCIIRWRTIKRHSPPVISSRIIIIEKDITVDSILNIVTP